METSVGTELPARRAETVVEQARAGHAAQLRDRAHVENSLIVLIGQVLPADLPEELSFILQRFLAAKGIGNSPVVGVGNHAHRPGAL